MDISKDGTRMEEFMKLFLIDNFAVITDKIATNIKNPAIYTDFRNSLTTNVGESIDSLYILTKYAYAANLITKDEWKFIISKREDTNEGATPQELPGVLGPSEPSEPLETP